MMAVLGIVTAGLMNLLFGSRSADGQGDKKPMNVTCFWKAALSSCVASPLGYLSLKYVTFPLMVLTKSCKPIPVMLIGIVGYRQKFPWCVLLLLILIDS